MMRAVGFHRFGGPEVLEPIERPIPVPGPGEVVVKVAAAAVNPTDLLMLGGAQAAMMQGLEPPFVAGMEFSGRVHAAGAGVGLVAGTPVFGVVNPRRPEGGAHAQYVRVPAASIAPLAEGADMTGAATIPMNGLTALLALEILDLRPGQSLLVTGGTGILGGSAIRLAREAGLRIFAGGRPEDAGLLRELGAEMVLPRDAGLIEALRADLPAGVDGMIDGALIGNSVSAAVRDGGAAVSLRMSHPIEDARLRTDCVSVIRGLERQDLLARLAALFTAGALPPRIAADGVVPFTDAQAAFRRAMAGGFRGRLVLDFGN